jgi:hypothetical protein
MLTLTAVMICNDHTFIMQCFQHFACLKIKMFHQPIANRLHIYLLLLVVLIETSFLELDILDINIKNTSEWYGGSKDELGPFGNNDFGGRFSRKTIKLCYISFGNNESGVVVSQGLSSVRSYEKVARFKLIWWDKCSGSKDGVSIWHPIVPPGCAMLGDLVVQG